jgi:hypothetical protein
MTILKFQRRNMGLKLSGIHQLLAYADYVNLLEDNIDTINKISEMLIDANKQVGR